MMWPLPSPNFDEHVTALITWRAELTDNERQFVEWVIDLIDAAQTRGCSVAFSADVLERLNDLHKNKAREVVYD